MAYPDGVYRTNINATLQGGETMTHTVWCRTDTLNAGIPDMTQQIANRIRDTWSQLVTVGLPNGASIGSRLHTETRYTNCTTYKVDALGKATELAEAAFDAQIAGTGTSALPPQLALVTTLLTNRPGRNGRGRIYLGGLSNNILGADGRLGTLTRDSMAGAMAEFYKAVRHTPLNGDTFRPVVVSPTITDSFKVTKVAVGDVLDTMRSRRASLTENKAIQVVDES